MDEQFLTVKDVARLLQVSTRTVWRWVNLERLHPTRLSRGTIRFRRSDVLHAIERGGGSTATERDGAMW